MSDRVIRFPPRRLASVWILSLGESGWLVLDGAHGWLHCNYGDAIADAPIRRGGKGMTHRDPQWGRA
jgi:hypothetical protein